jgi:hypothetical protein
MRVLGSVACAALMATAVLLAGSEAWLISGGVAIPLFMAWFMTRPGPRTTVDFRARQVHHRDGPLSFQQVRAVVFGTGLHVPVARPGHSTTAVQVWTLDLQTSRGPRSLALHSDEYALLFAARELAAALKVPLHDRCGPRRGGPSKEPHSEAPSASGLCVQEAADGLALSWNPRPDLRQQLAPLLPLVAGGLCVRWLLSPASRYYRPGVSLGILLCAVIFLFLLRHVLRISVSRLRLHEDALVLDSSLMTLPWRRRVRPSAVREVRVTQALGYSVQPWGQDVSEPEPEATHVDLVGDRKCLARLRISGTDATRAAELLRVRLVPASQTGREARSR